eukprot:TRINITY_DN1088_c0_g1_i1.p3 TRINITY_DN1088_c0_g1~~TRINITY_DN1088_c0_g1_i1.p3  ORF type:complete len:278 (-),score=77.66 TRINITY_DN1088_c0_g1_i1:377-1210(-)
MRVIFAFALLFAVVGAQYGPSATALAAATASIDDIVSAGSLAAAAASGEGASAEAAAAAAAGADGATAESAATASAGTTGAAIVPESPAPTKKVIKAPTHSKVLVVPAEKEEKDPKKAPVIVIKKAGDEKTCDVILADLLACADAEGDATVEVPYECLKKADVTIEDLVECGYIEVVPEPEPEAPKPAKKTYPVVYKKDPVVEEPEEPEVVYYTKAVKPATPVVTPVATPVPSGPSATATSTATAGEGGSASAVSYASVVGDAASAVAGAVASAMGM